MKINKLILKNYRNYTNCKVEFSDYLNIIIGNNAQGKTNLLEAIYYLSTTRSFRSRFDKDLILKNQDFAYIEGEIDKGMKNKLKAIINKSGKSLFINNNKIDKSSSFIGFLNAVIFAPSDIEIFSDAPKVRRKLIDIELGKISANYMANLNNYYKLVKERNVLLKNNVSDYNLYSVIEDQMINNQKFIIKYRSKFINSLNIYLNKYYQLLNSNKDIVSIDYLSCISDFNNIENEFKEKYQKNFNNDILIKSTSFGVHREDIIFKLNGELVTEYASQGQKRMICLSLKLALVEYIRDLTHDSPILLLDDVLSELDLNHQQLLINILTNNVQTFITTTSISANIKINKYKKIEIKEGKVKE